MNLQRLRTGARVIACVSALLLAAVLVPAAAHAAAAIENPIGCKTLGECLVNLVQGVLALVGVVAVGFIVYGGFLYITSGGNDDQIRAGKQAIFGAVVGIIFIGLAFAIVQFVSSALGVGGGAGGPGGAR